MFKTFIPRPLVLLAVLVHLIMVLAQPIVGTRSELLQDVPREISAALPFAHAFERRDNANIQRGHLREVLAQQQLREGHEGQRAEREVELDLILDGHIRALDAALEGNASREQRQPLYIAVDIAFHTLVDFGVTDYRHNIQNLWEDTLAEDREALKALPTHASAGQRALHTNAVIGDIQMLCRSERDETRLRTYHAEIEALRASIRPHQS
jgi:hypothetical protein